MNVDALEARLLNDFQREFPLTARPYAALAEVCDSSEALVLSGLRRLCARGAVSRVGPVFGVNRVGASTLAAMAIPPAELERVAEQVNAFPEVNHNYAREHRFNLWFVANAPSREALKAALDGIAEATGYAVMDLPMVRDHHIDLGFRMPLNGERMDSALRKPRRQIAGRCLKPGQHDALIAAIQSGLPLTARPYAAVARHIGVDEDEVLDGIAALQADGTIRRLGVVVRHHELGYRANAMVVWNVPDDEVDALGDRLGTQPRVTLSYQRPRRPPEWPYNLFTMIHGRSRDEVLVEVDRLVATLGLAHIPHEPLFSTRRFKQRGARYRA